MKLLGYLFQLKFCSSVGSFFGVSILGIYRDEAYSNKPPTLTTN